MSQCRFTAAASRDLEDIIDSIADDRGLDAADRFLSQINVQCRRLAQFPGMGRRRNELSPSLRSFPFQIYLIFYREIDNGVEIARIISPVLGR
jgi:toxin ParE1/3/4